MDDRLQLTQTLIAEGVLRTPIIIDAFKAIDRRDFVPAGLTGEAYLDTALPIGEGQTISQPYTVAFILELLQPVPGENILDVGYGSGWQTSLLAYIVSQGAPPASLAVGGHVTALEIVPNLCDWGKRNTAKYSFPAKGIVEMHCMSALGGYPKRAPFDKIVAGAAGEMVPEAWLEQTKVGGRIVTPIGSSIFQLVKKNETEWERHEYPGFAFVPLVVE